MEALHFDRANKKITHHRDYPIPKPTRPDDVVVRVAYSGVCGTDLHIVKAEFPSASSLLLGHEFSGVVEAVGDGSVSQFSAGAQVVINPNSNCGSCRYCERAEPHHCLSVKAGDIKSIGCERDGGWAEYCLLDARRVHALPHGLGLQHAALVEPVSCVLRGWDRIGASVSEDAQVLVCGAGLIGVLWTLLLHHKGHRLITVCEVREGRRHSLANLQLAGVRVLAPDDLKEGEDVFQLSVDCTGHPAALEMSLNLIDAGGTILVFGCAPEHAKSSVSPYQIYKKEVKIVGSLVNPHTFSRAIQLVKDMSATYLRDLDRLGIKQYRLKDYAEALADLGEGKISKAMFKVK